MFQILSKVSRETDQSEKYLLVFLPTFIEIRSLKYIQNLPDRFISLFVLIIK
jgi:hypothetical protein